MARSLPEKLGRGMTPGEERSVGPCWSLTWIVYRLVKELDCVKSPVLVKNRGLKQENFTQKKALSCCLRNSHAVGRASEEGGGGAQFAPYHGISWTDQSRAAGAKRGSSPQRDLI